MLLYIYYSANSVDGFRKHQHIQYQTESVVDIHYFRGSFRKQYRGAVTGFLCGLTQDMLSGRVIGFYALLGLYLGLGIALINKRLYKENVWWQFSRLLFLR